MATQLALDPDEALADTGLPANDEAQSDDARAIEERATEAGWRGPDNYKGDPALFIGAEAYLKRAQEVLPLVKKENGKLRNEIDFLKRKMKQLEKAEQGAYKNALADLERRQEVAVETGNVAENKRIMGEIKELGKNIATEAPADREKEAIKAFGEWRDDNEWYDLGGLAGATDAEKRQRTYFDRMVQVHSDKTEDMAPAEFIAYIGELVEARHPTAKAPRTKPQSDVAGVTPGGARKGVKTGANLPADAKETAERYIRLKIPGYTGKTKAEAHDLFAKDFDWSAP